MLEPILGCNLSCPACYIGSGMISRPKDTLGFEDFKVIAEKIKPYAEFVYLHIWGEPLLHPKILDMIAITREFSRVHISTHGQSLTRERAHQIVKAGLTDIVVSLDGIDQRTYEIYRVGGRARKAIDGINYLIEAKEAAGSEMNIIVQFIVMKHNEHEIPLLRKIFQDKPVILNLKSMYVQSYEQALEFLPTQKGYHRYTIKENAAVLNADKTKCRDPFEVMTILVNGDVVQCCFDSSGEIVLGNILRSSLMDIWQGQKAQDLRKRFLTGHLNHVCSSMKCGMGKEGEMRPDSIEASRPLRGLADFVLRRLKRLVGA